MLLSIDTATRSLSVALHDGTEIRAEITLPTDGRHTTELLPLIDQAMRACSIKNSDLSLIALSSGPGSFNGLRVGFSAAKGLAYALRLPLITIPTLQIVAHGVPKAGDTLVAVAQAGRGRVCAQNFTLDSYSNDNGWTPLDDIRIVGWPDLLDNLTPADWTLIAGEIDAEGRTLIQSRDQVRIVQSAYLLRRAGMLADLAWAKWRDTPEHERHQFDPANAAPIYLHQPGVPHP